MATDLKLQMKQFNGTDYDNIYPKTLAEQVSVDSSRQFVTQDQKDKIDTAVQKAGDTMTGALTLSGAPTAELHAATKKYVDDNIGGGAGVKIVVSSVQPAAGDLKVGDFWYEELA